jgi:hypothetical protein
MMCDTDRAAPQLARELEAAARELGAALGPEGASEAAMRLLGLALRKLEFETARAHPAGRALSGTAPARGPRPWAGIH